ncbi:MAG: type II secretion system GspH family protein [Cystobacterineae bacterium]|nr:type II secretion system GspH family protein [Cystobacterineae bacterium]
MSRGMTLIELLVSMAIIAVILGLTVVGIGALTGTQAKAVTNELVGAIRTLYDTSALTGRTCRLAFSLPDDNNTASETRYQTECSEKATAIRRESTQQLELKQSIAPQTETEKEERQKIEALLLHTNFSEQETKPRTLPSAVTLSVWTEHQLKAKNEGQAYLYFFPQGFTENAQIVVRQSDNAWTLVVSGLTGKVQIIPEALEPPI